MNASREAEPSYPQEPIVARINTAVAQAENALERTRTELLACMAERDELKLRVAKAEAWYRANGAALKAISAAGLNPTKATAMVAERLTQGVLIDVPVQTVECNRCPGAEGMYYWGELLNGQKEFKGRCFRCKGTGRMSARTAR